MKVLVVTDEELLTPLVFSTLTAFLQSDAAVESFFSAGDMGNEYLLMLTELEKEDGCWSSETGSVSWVEVQGGK